MLNFFLFKNYFFKILQSGLYLDFFFKKLSENFIRNFLIYSSNFLGEKYIIEYLTKKLVENIIFSLSNNINFYYINYNFFFLHLLSVILYFFSFINICYIFIL